MKASTLFFLLPGIMAALLLPEYGKAQPTAVQNQPAPAVKTTATAQTEPTNAPATPAPSSGALARFITRPGSTMRLLGYAGGIHGPWQVEGATILGKLDVGPNFPMEPGQAVTPGPVVAAADVYIPVTSLKNRYGSLPNDALESIMYEKLKPEAQKSIHFHLTELVLKEAPKGKDQSYLFDSQGELAVAGVTNKLTMPVQVLPLGDGKLKISGTTTVKMTSFKIEPPVLIGPLKTYDDVKLSFDWMVGQKPAAAAAAAK